jgi:hypothetical protein
MFDRFNESARRALFFARYAVTRLGGATIEPEHLVLGVLQDSPHVVTRFALATADALRMRIEAKVTGPAREPSSAELPFSAAARMALERAASEADDLRSHSIRSEHLILGVIADTSGTATGILNEARLDIRAMRDYARNTAVDATATPEVSWHTGGSVIRQWKGVARRELADAYVVHLRRETFPLLSRLAGFVTASILKRDVEDGIEFQVQTVWQSVAAIEAFAGKDISVAVVPPAAQALLARYDRDVTHYEIV